MMTSGLLVFSFVAGVLTILAPCVLPLLPVIVGGSLVQGRNWVRAAIIAGSLAISLIVFTLILKLSTALIAVPPGVWTTVSGGIVLLFGLITLFPGVWDQVTLTLRLNRTTDTWLSGSARYSGWLGPILIGAALGPVFSSCSPTYALILATVLPADFRLGIIYLLLYVLGLVLMLLVVAVLGQRLVSHLGWAVNPQSKFKRTLGLLLVVVGFLIVTGFEKKLEVYLVENNPFDVTQLELKFLNPASSNTLPPESVGQTTSARFSVTRPYPAPELQGIVGWVNTVPLTLGQLRGKVVVIDFWTYSCINCIRTIPFLSEWYNRYQADGLVIIGVHAPEFSFEKIRGNVERAVQKDGIEYPVALDNDFITWQAYDNHYWPAKYFIDKQGRVRHTHFGEGEYQESEAVIRALLREDGGQIAMLPLPITPQQNEAPFRRDQTPETYLGWGRADRQVTEPALQHDEAVNYRLNNVGLHQWSLGGDWLVDHEKITSQQDGTILRLRFAAKDVYLVIGSQTPAELELTLNDHPLTAGNGGGSDVTIDGKVLVNDDRLYHLVSLPEFVSGAELEITFPAQTKVNAFTFGS